MHTNKNDTNIKHTKLKHTKLPVYIARSRQTTEANKTGTWRVMSPAYEEKTSPCSAACPAGEDIALIQMLTSRGLFKEAWEKILMENPFPSICGRVCHHPCENMCNRKQFDEPVAINLIERFLSDWADAKGHRLSFESPEPKKEKIAIIGAGPSGLSASCFLSRMGYRCTIFEAKSEPGGILRWGIPEYRLPTDVLQREIAQIKASGVEIRCGHPVSSSFLMSIKKEYNAVFIGCGHGQSSQLDIDGENLTVDGLHFLSELKRNKGSLNNKLAILSVEAPVWQGAKTQEYQDILSFRNAVRRDASALKMSSYFCASPKKGRLKGKVVILGGGNTAVDAARSVLRMGGAPLIVYRRRREDMPAFSEEVLAAIEEGVELLELYGPVKIEKVDKDCRLTLQKMRISDLKDEKKYEKKAAVEPDIGKIKTINAKMVIKAIGAVPMESWHKPPVNRKDILQLSNMTISFEKSGIPVVFGGDLASEVKSVVHAVASGKHAAIALDIFFKEGKEKIKTRMSNCSVGNGSSFSFEIYQNKNRRFRKADIVSYEQINTDYFDKVQKITCSRLPLEQATNNFAEIALNISEDFALQEAERCFNCGICNQCDNCFIFCPEVAVLHDDSEQGRHINYDYCKGCGICVEECPRNAMVLSEPIEEEIV